MEVPVVPVIIHFERWDCPLPSSYGGTPMAMVSTPVAAPPSHASSRPNCSTAWPPRNGMQQTKMFVLKWGAWKQTLGWLTKLGIQMDSGQFNQLETRRDGIIQKNGGISEISEQIKPEKHLDVWKQEYSVLLISKIGIQELRFHDEMRGFQPKQCRSNHADLCPLQNDDTHGPLFRIWIVQQGDGFPSHCGLLVHLPTMGYDYI